MMEQGALSPFIEVPDTIAELLAVGASVPLGQGGKVHVWGRNDMDTNQKLGIRWIVMDPDGVVVEDYEDWQTFSATPGGTHEFISPGRFDLNKEGTWSIGMVLSMNPDFPVVVDRYSGILCVVEKVVVLIEGTIIRKELEYSGSGDGTIPVVGVPQGVSAKLHVWGRNDMSISQGMGIYWFVADPDGMIVEEYEDWGGTIGAGQDHEFISSGQFDLNKAGKYTTWIELLMGTQDNPEIVDRYIGDLCTVVALEYKGTISKKELEYDETRITIPVY